MAEKNCSICNGSADKEFKRTEVWTNENWRLTMTTYKKVKGLCYLEPKRHIPYITELDGVEALEFGPTLAKITNALKITCNVDLVYVYIFGGHIPHLHVHLVPPIENDLYQTTIVTNDDVIGNDLLKDNEIAPLKKEILKHII